MKHIVPHLLLITMISSLIFIVSCEKDDICIEGTLTTPHLIIRFYDVSNQNITKEVDNLLIVGDVNGTLTSYGTETTTDSIAIPLRVLENTTTFTLIKDYAIDDNGTPDDDTDDFATGNEDDIVLTYTNDHIYISKACGYKNYFNDLTIDLDATDIDPWAFITSESVINNTIQNEDSAHINIYH